MLSFVFLLALLPGVAFPAAATLHRLTFGQWITLDILSADVQRVMTWAVILGTVSLVFMVAWGSRELRLLWRVPLLGAAGMACVVAGWLSLVAELPVPAVLVCLSGGLMLLVARRSASISAGSEPKGS